MTLKTEFNLNQTLENLKNLSEKKEYRDGMHLGLNSKDFEEYGLALEKEFGELIYNKVILKRPDTILELGTANGYSTCWFLLGLMKISHGTIVTVDKVDRRPKIWEILDISTNRIIEFFKTTEEFVKGCRSKFDMVLLDTEHRVELVTKDIEMIIPFLNKGAILFIHDTFGDPDMGKQLKTYLMNSGKFDYESIDKSCGLGIAMYKGDKNGSSVN